MFFAHFFIIIIKISIITTMIIMAIIIIIIGIVNQGHSSNLTKYTRTTIGKPWTLEGGYRQKIFLNMTRGKLKSVGIVEKLVLQTKT